MSSGFLWRFDAIFAVNQPAFILGGVDFAGAAAGVADSRGGQAPNVAVETVNSGSILITNVNRLLSFAVFFPGRRAIQFADRNAATGCPQLAQFLFGPFQTTDVINPAFRGRLRWNIPVSYTHLDVYKRQLYGGRQ